MAKQNSKNEVFDNWTKTPRKTQILAMIWKDFRRDDIQIWKQRWRKTSPTETNETQWNYFRTKRMASKMNKSV